MKKKSNKKSIEFKKKFYKKGIAYIPKDINYIEFDPDIDDFDKFAILSGEYQYIQFTVLGYVVTYLIIDKVLVELPIQAIYYLLDYNDSNNNTIVVYDRKAKEVN